MPTYLYKPVNNTTVTLLGTDIRVTTDGVSFNTDNTELNGYVPEVLDRYIDGVLNNNIVQTGAAPQVDPLTNSQLRATPVATSESKGGSSATITTNTVAVTGSFAAITVLADAVFTSLTRTNTTGSLGSTTVPAGVTIFGDITGYQLASGAVIAYGA